MASSKEKVKGRTYNMNHLDNTINPKKWLKLVAALLGTVLVVSAITSYFLDPSMYYRKPSYRAFINPRYMNIGIIKNYSFDSVIVGSSMIMNSNMESFRKKLGWNPIKLTWGATTAADLGMLTKAAIKYKNPKNIFFSLDIFSFDTVPNTHQNIPEFLYDDTPFNDYKYLLGYETWLRFLPMDALINSSLSLGIKLPQQFMVNSEIDKIGEWKDEFKFGKKYVIKELKGSAMAWIKKETSSQYFKTTTENLDENLIKIIQQDPGCKFNVVFPPYSVLPWTQALATGNLDNYLKFKSVACEKLLKFDNVQVFDFQPIESIITNLDNYKDPTHFKPEFNEFMLDCVISGKYRVRSSVDVQKNVVELKRLASLHSIKWYVKQ